MIEGPESEVDVPREKGGWRSLSPENKFLLLILGFTAFFDGFDRGIIQVALPQIRETFESALKFGERALIELGMDEGQAAEAIGDVRRRDEARLDLQLTGGIKAGRQLMRGNMPTPQPAPYVKPRREGRLLNEDEAGPAAPDTRREPAET